MDFKSGSLFCGTRLASIGLLAAGALTTANVSAETVFAVNGVNVDSAVVDLYFESRLGNQDSPATPAQREALIAELRDIYVLATHKNAAAHASDPRIAAQLELQKQSILAQAVAADMFDEITVSDEEMRAEYGEQVKLAPPLQFKASHILVESQGEALELIGQLDKGANFKTLASEHSIDPSAATNGGDLGWFSPNQMVAPFSAAVQTIEDGKYSKEPVQTQFGWHVILREASRETQPPTFESVQDNIKNVVQQRKFQEMLAGMRAAAK